MLWFWYLKSSVSLKVSRRLRPAEPLGFPAGERDRNEGDDTVDPPRVYEELHHEPDNHDGREIRP